MLINQCWTRVFPVLCVPLMNPISKVESIPSKLSLWSVFAPALISLSCQPLLLIMYTKHCRVRSAVESQVQLESFVCLSVMLTSCGWGFLEWDFPCLLIHMSQAQEDSWRFSSQHVYPNFAGKWACEFNPEKERCIMLHLCSITRVSSAMMLAAKCKDSLTSNLL